MTDVSPELEAWVASQQDFELFVAPNGKTKAKCTLTNHELLPQLEMCVAYLSGKAYKKARRKQELESFDFSQFEPHIVAHETDPHLLLCVRTQKTLMRDVTAVQNYVKSRGYQVAVEHWKKGQTKSGIEISKLGQAGKRKSSEADEQEDDAEEGEDEDDITAAEFAEMEFLAGREDAGDSDDAEDDDEGELVDRPQTNDSFVLADLERQVLGYDSEEDDHAQDLFGQKVEKQRQTQQNPKGRKPKSEKAARKEAHRLKRLQRLEKKRHKQATASQVADASGGASQKAKKGPAEGGKKKKRRIEIVSEEIAE